jgi:tight adherence protein B
MLSPEYGLLFLAAAIFLLVVLMLTQVGPGGRRRQTPIDEESESTERFLRSIAPTQSAPTMGSMQSIDSKFADIVHRADLKMSPDQASAVMLLTGAVVAAALYFWQSEIWISTLGFFGGMGLIFLYYMIKQMGFRRRLQNQIPDALFLIARSVRSGLSLEQAIDLTAQQDVQPLANEFKQAAQQIKLGLSIPAALQRMAKRMRLHDFDAFVSTVAVYSRTGGNLPLLLDRLAASARDHNQFRGHFFAATAQARLSALFVGLAAPLLLLAYVFLDPEHLEAFFREDTGYYILAGCLGLELIGAFWIYQVLKIDYS